MRAGAVLRRRCLVRAVILAMGLAATAVLLLAAANRIVPFTEAWAFGGIAACWAGSAAALLVWCLRLLLCFSSPERLALAVEARRPELMDALICAVELEARPAAARRELERALIEQMARQSALLDFRALLLLPAQRWRALLLPALLFGALTAAALRSQLMTKAWYHARDLVGGARTGLLIRPGNTEVAERRDVRVDLQVRRWEDQARIDVVDAAGRGRFPMNRAEPGRHFFTFYDLDGDLRYRITTPSLRSRWYRVRTYRPPAIRQAAIRVLAPEYSGREPVNHEELTDIRALTGSRVQVRLQLTAETRSELFANAGPVPPTRVAPGTYEHSFPVTASTEFHVRVRDDAGHDTETRRFRVEAEPDLPPLVEILRPREDSAVAAAASVGLEVRASDDFGLAQVALSVAVSGRPRRETILYGPGPDKDVTLAPTLSMEQLGAAEGDVVSYFFTARDNREPAPQTARSAVYFVVVRPELEDMPPAEDGERRTLDMSELIAESKRLIRLTWDVAGAAPPDAAAAAADLQGSLGDLRIAALRQFHKETAAAAGAAALLGYLREAATDIGQAEELVAADMLPDSISAQERGLAKLVALENELLKNTAQSEQGDGEGTPPQRQADERTPDEGAAKEAELAALAEALTQARALAERQERLNQSVQRQMGTAVPETLARGLGAKQREVKAGVGELQAALEALDQMPQASRQTAAADRDMANAARQFDTGLLRAGWRHGARAGRSLAAAVQSLEEEYRRAAGNEVARLRDAAQELANQQEAAAQQSRTLQETKQPAPAAVAAARKRQESLRAAAGDLTGAIARAAAELEEAYPAAADAVTAAQILARQQKLNSNMARAANALLYERFDRAHPPQMKAAEVLGAMAQKLDAAARTLPAVSREELATTLEQMRHAAQEVGRAQGVPDPAAAAQLDAVRRTAADRLGALSSQLQDPILEQIVEALADGPGSTESMPASRQLLALLRAAASVLERHLLSAAVTRQLSLSRRTSVPPARYRRLVEQYFKDLSTSE